MKSLKFLIPLALFVVLALFLAAGLKLDPKEVPSPLIGKPAPAFKLTRLDDPAATVSREDMLGKVWVLNVWASWCVACRQEHPALVAFARTKQVPLIGLNYKDARVDGMAWLEQFGNPYDFSVFDGDGRMGIDYGVYGVPETFIIDRQGVVRFKHIGPLTPDLIRDRIEPVLASLRA